MWQAAPYNLEIERSDQQDNNVIKPRVDLLWKTIMRKAGFV